MNKICTSIVQSKHLLELGLDAKTADMSYYEAINGDYYTQVERESEDDIPAWSLSALLSLMPVPYQLTSNDEDKYQFMLVTNLRHDWYDSPIEAVYTMVVWLLENKKL